MGKTLEETCVGSLVAKKRPIISVPDVATVRTALQVMIAENIVALPVSAPPGKWLGAGASVIIDKDKQYIGMVSMIDVAMHLAATQCAGDALEQPVAELIGSSAEGLSMWVFRFDARLAEVLEPLSKGIHRLLVRAPEGPHKQAQGGQSLAASDYFFLSQTDVVGFLLAHLDDLGPVVERTLTELSLVDALFPPLAVSEADTVLDALRLMRKAAGVRAVAVVASGTGAAATIDSSISEGSSASALAHGAPRQELESGGITAASTTMWKRGGRLMGTLSVTDLRGLDEERLLKLSSTTVGAFLAEVQGQSPAAFSPAARPPIACRPEAPLSLALSLAVTHHVHRVWVTTESDDLVGVVSLSDMLAALRRGSESVSPFGA